MIHCNELAYCVTAEWPHLKRNLDFWCAHPIAGSADMTQTGDAYFPQWNPMNPPMPDEAKIAELWAKWGQAAIEYWAADEVRMRRDWALAEADGLIGRAEDGGDQEKLRALRAYRQSLGDVRQQPGFPFSFAWPVKPQD